MTGKWPALRLLPGLLGGLLTFPPPWPQEAEPAIEYAVEESVGGQSRRIECFTAAELPFAATAFQMRMPPQGFAQKSEPAELEWNGKKLKGTRIIWTRDESAGHPNHKAKKIEVETSPDVPTPAFLFPMQRGPGYPVPAGTVTYKVTPTEGSPPIDGRLRGPAPAIVGEKEGDAHTFVAGIGGPDDQQTNTLRISRAVPFGISGIEFETRGPRAIKGCMRIVTAHKADLPAEFEAFPDAGFGLAPPKGYKRVAAGEGEIVRFQDPGGRHVSVATFDPGGKSIDAWFDARLKDWADRGLSICGVAFAGHIGGEPSGSTSVASSGLMAKYAIRNGKGYRVEIAGGTTMVPQDLRGVLRGWRWLKP